MALTLPKLAVPKLAVPKLAVPKLALDKKQWPAIVGGVVVIAAAGWFGWQYFADEAPPPPPAAKPQATAAAAPAKTAAQADAGQARDKLIDDVLGASGLKQQLNQLPQRLTSGIKQSEGRPAKKSPAAARAIEDAMAKSFTAEGFQGRVSADLKKNFDQKRMQALLKDFSTPAAKTMVELERASPTPQELAQFARSPGATRPTPERAALIKRIDAATKASELAVEAAFASMKALTLSMVGGNADKASAIDKAIERQRADTTQKIRDATLLNLAYSYKDASDADLEKYAGIYEAENTKWFYALVYASLLEEIKAASTRAGELIANEKLVPAPTATRTAGSRAHADARACLELGTNAAIIKCAEAYR